MSLQPEARSGRSTSTEEAQHFSTSVEPGNISGQHAHFNKIISEYAIIIFENI